MIGSLQEFIGPVDANKFLSLTKPKKKSWSMALQPRSLQKNNKNSTPRQMNYSSHISSVRFGGKQQDYMSSSRERWKLQSKESIDDSLTISKPDKKSKWVEHVADDKKNVLKVYQKLKKREQIQKNAKLLQKQKEVQTKGKPKQSYLHLKPNLKHDHQLLRSIIRVQQQSLLNPKTFLEMSLQSIASSFTQVKMKPMLNMSKEQSQRLLTSIKQNQNKSDQGRKLQYLRRQVMPSGIKHTNKPNQDPSSHAYQSQRMLLWNTMKWSKKRAKSTKSYQKKLGIEEQSQNFQTILTNNRKELFKKIDQLIDKPQNPRKGSLRGSVRFFK